MKHGLISSATILALAACHTGALADGAADATLSNLTVRLIDLSPQDGIAPSVVFTPTVGSFAGATVSTQVPVVYLYDMHDGGGAFAPTSASVSSPNGRVGGAASISGDAFSDAGASVTTSAFAVASYQASGASELYLGLSDGGRPMPFTLSPGTEMVISASGAAMASVDEWHQYYEEAIGELRLLLSGTTTDGTQTSDADETAGAGFSYGPSSASFSGALSVSFTNATASSASGTFFGAATSYVFTEASPPVPEPSGDSLLLVALGTFCVLSRRRRAR
jgi:hypothetical protein